MTVDEQDVLGRKRHSERLILESTFLWNNKACKKEYYNRKYWKESVVERI